MASSSTVDEVVHIVRSPRDKRDYRAITLNNGLRAVLVHAPDSHKAAAAFAVNAGHFDDPVHTQGLAHFLEHLLFLGNEKYPSPSAFSDFLNAYGGQQNAWTGTEYANYYFDCQAHALERALDYFSAMFKQPLFAQEWIDKELQSIESEFRLKQQDELRRLYQVHKTTSNPEHPFCKFSVGNLTTLKDDDNGTLADKLRHFFNQYYTADNASLVIAGPQSLDALAELADKHFNDIAGCGDNRPSQRKVVEVPLYLPEHLGVKLQVKPVKPARRLIITLPLPAIDDDYAHKTTSFIAHLLGYEGPNSLYACLRKKGYINSLSAGGGISGSNFKDFNINIQLTETGEQNLISVAQWVFSYLNLIQQHGIEDWRYAERRVNSELSFNYQEATPVGELVSQLAINAHHYPVADTVYGDYRMDCLNNIRATELLNLMRPERARITLVSSDANTDQETALYQTPFSIRPLKNDELTQLNQQPADFSAQLPGRNRFISDHSQPYPLEVADKKLPTALVSNEALDLWHLQDPDFRVPKGHIYLNLQAPAVTASAENFGCSRIWAELMIDALNEDLYDAEVAGLHFNIYPTQTGITIHTTGLSAGQLPLLSYLMRQAWSVRFERQRWQAVSQQLINNWRSAHQHQPLNMLFSELNLALQQGLFRLSDMAAACSPLSYTHFARTVSTLFDSLHISAFIHGDWQRQHADQLHTLIHANTPLKSVSVKPQRQQIKRLIEAAPSQIITVPTEHDDHAALCYFQGPSDSPSDQVAMMLLQQLIHQFVFDQLRTQRQLGYMAGSQYFGLQRIPGIIIFVQSPSTQPSDLQTHILDVTRAAADKLNTLSLKEWSHTKSVLEQQLAVDDRSLRVRSQRLWGAIQLGDTRFDRAKQLRAALGNWQLDEWLSYVNRLLFEQPASLQLQTRAIGR